MSESTEVLRYVRPGDLPYALLVLAVAIVAARLLGRSVDRLGQRFADRRLLLQQVGSLLRFATYLLGVVAATATVIELTPEVTLALGGTAAVAIGFALKDLVASVVAGLIVLVDKPFQVGDRVSFGPYYGEIRFIGLRSVRLQTLDDSQITIPNNLFLTESVSSANAGAVNMLVQLDFFVGIDQDLPAAKRVVGEALTTSRYVHLRRPWVVLVNQVFQEGYPALRLRAKAYVLDVKFEKEFETDVTERVVEGLAEAGIGPPAVLHRRLDPPRAAGPRRAA